MQTVVFEPDATDSFNAMFESITTDFDDLGGDRCYDQNIDGKHCPWKAHLKVELGGGGEFCKDKWVHVVCKAVQLFKESGSGSCEEAVSRCCVGVDINSNLTSYQYYRYRLYDSIMFV